MKKLLYVATVLIFGLMIAGCEDKKDDKPQSISGDASMQINNQTQYKQNIRLDGIYIGDVEAHSVRTWRIPSGPHTALAHDNVTGDASFPFTVARGGTKKLIVRITFRSVGMAAELDGSKLSIPSSKEIISQ